MSARCTNCGVDNGKHTLWCYNNREPLPTEQANDRQVAGEHYKTQAIQPWDYIAANQLGFFEGNVVKYVTRWQVKGGLADLEKARHYLDKLIEMQSK